MAYQEDVNINLNVLAGAMGGITAIMGGMSALTSTFGEFGTQAVDNFGAIDGLIVTTSALIATFGAQAAESFGEFQQGLKIVQTVSGQTGYAIEQLGQKANEMSVRYRTAIGDITEGLQTLGRAGLNSASTQMEVLESGLQTAKLEGRNLNGVLEEIIQNTAMLGGDLKSVDFGSQSEYLNSLMVGTSMTAPINSHDISQTLQYAGGTAAAAGATIDDTKGKEKVEDLMGTIAAFAQKGVTGSMAGTALRAFFTKPASQDTSVTDALDVLGLKPEDLWENGGESMKKVSDQIAIIQRRMDAMNLSTMEQVELWGKMVGPKMGQQMMKLDASDIKELTSDIQSANSAEELAAKTLNTYTQNISELGQQGDLVFRQLGSSAVMFLNPVVEILSKITSVFANPWANMTIFAGGLALISHGIRKGYTMVKTLFSQIMGLIRNVDAGMANLAGSSDGFTAGIGRSASQVDILNSKLKETNATMQLIQAQSMNIRGKDWVANGGRIGDKIDRGVISSAPQNIFIGGITESGLKIGDPGKYYTMEESSELKKATQEESSKNMAIKKQIDKSTAQYEQSFVNLNNVIREKKLELDQITKTNPKYDGLNREDYAHAKKLLGDSADMSSRENIWLGLDKRDAKLFKEYQDAYFYEDLTQIKAPDKSSKKIQSEIDEIIQKKDEEIKELRTTTENGLAKAKKTKVDAQGQKITSMSLYKKRSYENLNKEITKVENAAEEAVFALEAEFHEALMFEEQLKNLGLRSTTEIQEDINEGRRLMGRINDVPKESARKAKVLNQEITTAQQFALLDKTMRDEEYLDQVYPTLSKNELKEKAKELTVQMQTQFKVVEEKVFEQEMRKLQQMAEAGDELAAQTLAQNKIVAKAGLQKIPGTNRRQLVTNVPVKPEDDFITSMARKNIETGNAETMAKAQAAFQERVRAQAAGETGFMSKIRDSSSNILNSYNNALNRAREGLSQWSVGLKQSAILRQGWDQMTKMEWATLEGSVTNAVLGMETEFMTLSEVTAALIESTGMSAEQLYNLFSKSTELSSIFNELNLVTAENVEVTQQVIMSELEEIGANEVSASSGILSSIGGAIGGAAQGLMGLMGGAIPAAMMGFMFIQQAFTSSQQAWQESMQKASEAISEAMDRQSKAEDAIKEAYSKEHNDASELELNDQVLAAYANIYDSTMDHNIKLDENTQELMRATESYKQKVDASADYAVDDRIWGVGSWGSKISDYMGAFQTRFWDFGSDIRDAVFQDLTDSDRAWFNIQNNPNGAGSWGQFTDEYGWERTSGKGYFDSNNVVLTASQSDDNYPWLKEFAPIIASDVWDLGVEEGLKQAFGGDFNKIADILQSTTGKSGIDAYKETAFGMQADNIEKYFNDPHQQNQLQMNLKDYQDDFKQIGYQTRAFEKVSKGKSALDTFQQGANAAGGKGESTTKAGFKALEKAGNKDTNKLIHYIKTLSLKTGMDAQRVLLAAQLQQMQDMQQIANDVVSPNMMAQTQQALAQTAIAQGNTAPIQDSASGALTAGANAKAIAALLQVQQEGTLKEGTQSYAIDTLHLTEAGEMSKEEVYAKAIEAFNKGNTSDPWYKAGKYYLESYARVNGMEYGRSGENLDEYIKSFMENSDQDFSHMLGTLRKGGQAALANQILTAYDDEAANANKDTSDTGSGSGSGSDKDSDKGSTKSRVDLVLCSKKEIPKLNVNLFKKPPKLTVLNKNFKLRDIQINTQDKPDSIMNAVKNGLIETQKRMDPKIVQDEQAVYDPLAATDGTLPNGNSKVTSK